MISLSWFLNFRFCFRISKDFRTSSISPSINFFFLESAWIIRFNFYRCHAIATISRDPRHSVEERFERILEDEPDSLAEKNCLWTGWKIAYHLALFSSKIYTSGIEHYFTLYFVYFLNPIKLYFRLNRMLMKFASYFEALK